MDDELKNKWLEALRSGKYKQGQKTFRTESNCYCCLGVLADLVAPKSWSARTQEPCDPLGEKFFTWQSPILEDVQHSAGFNDDELEQFGFSDEAQWDLINMNDEGESFETIADYIEKNL